MTEKASEKKDALLAAFFMRLQRHTELTRPCREAIAAATMPPRRLCKAECLQHGGERIDVLWVLIKGSVLISRRLGNGTQQHLALHTPGELPDQEGFVLGRSTLSICAVTPSAAVGLPRPALTAVLNAHPELCQALQREMALKARIAQEWMVSMGRRPAYANLAHFILELSARVAQDSGGIMDELQLTLTQVELADLLGLSVVHLNRILQHMRQERLIELSRGRLHIVNRAKLEDVAGFDPGYLQPLNDQAKRDFPLPPARALCGFVAGQQASTP